MQRPKCETNKAQILWDVDTTNDGISMEMISNTNGQAGYRFVFEIKIKIY